MIIFRLTWNGTWSGADKVFVRRRLDSVVPASVVGQVFTYEWDDGWSVRISVEKVSAVEAIGIAKQSKGFCGYDWMIDSIIKYGEILDGRARAKKDGYFFYNGEYLSPEDIAVRLTEYKDKIAELKAAQRWIPVSERLPEDGEPVLAAYVDTMLTAAYYRHHIAFGGVDNWWDVEGCHTGNPTHWMPLPEPPEESKKW